MKVSSRRRDEDSRRINDEVRGLHALVPKALKSQEEATDTRLRELNTELRSLKTLISNRMSGQGVPQTGVPRSAASSAAAAGAPVNGANMFGAQGTASTNSDLKPGVIPMSEIRNAEGAASPAPTDGAATAQPERSATASPMGRFGQRGGIPAWQMAAKKKEEDEKKEAATSAEDSAAADSLVS